MNHKQLQILVSSYLDGEVSANEKAIVKEHLKNCSECRTFIKQIYHIQEGIAGIGEAELVPGFANHVCNLVVRQEEQTEKWISIEHLARNAVFAISVFVIVMFFITSFDDESSLGISEVLIDGTGKDSIATQVLLNQGDLSKNDLLYAVMTNKE